MTDAPIDFEAAVRDARVVLADEAAPVSAATTRPQYVVNLARAFLATQGQGVVMVPVDTELLAKHGEWTREPLLVLLEGDATEGYRLTFRATPRPVVTEAMVEAAMRADGFLYAAVAETRPQLLEECRAWYRNILTAALEAAHE